MDVGYEKIDTFCKGVNVKKLEIVRQYMSGGAIALLYCLTFNAWISYIHPEHLEVFNLVAHMVIGLLGVIAGVFFFDYGLAIGFAGGGFLSITMGSIKYWKQFHSLGKFLFGIGILLILAYFTFKVLDKDSK